MQPVEVIGRVKVHEFMVKYILKAVEWEVLKNTELGSWKKDLKANYK